MKAIKKRDLRIFTSIWGVIFLIIAVSPLLKNSEIRIWALPFSGLFFILNFSPVILTRPYRLWIRFGEFIGLVMSRIILTIIFYLIFTPVSLILKISGKDLLSQKWDKNTDTYWKTRETEPQPLKNQF